jgi:hypothetical protein
LALTVETDGAREFPVEGFNVGGDLLMHLVFFIRVIEDNDVVVARRPTKFVIEFTKEPSGELLIPRIVGEDFLLIRRKIHRWNCLGGTTVLMNW